MKLCVLGPVNTVTRNAGIIKDAFPELDVYEAAYDVYTEALDMIDQIQQEADMVLFPGKASYALCKRSRRQLIPWEYLPRHISSLHRTLLEVQRRFHCGICRISYDTLDSSLILTAYQEIGFRAEDLRLYVAEQRLLDPGYLDYLMEFHQNNYCRNGVSCCITGLTEIAGRLNQLKIPCAVTLPASTLVIDTVKRLQLRYQAQLNLESWIVVIMLEVSFAGHYSIMGEDDYGYLANRIKVLENIYSFSSRIDGVVVEDTPKSFLIFTTRKLIELETNHFQYLDLLDILNICRAENIAVGIGCGNTACESRSHARTAIEMAKKASSNCAYVVLEDGSVLKPLISRQESPADEIQIDRNLTLAAKRAGLSATTLFAILKHTRKSGLEEFTSRQLASLCGFSTRTMDRILQKLLSAGCCKVIGMYSENGCGRPSRVFQFTWSNLL